MNARPFNNDPHDQFKLPASTQSESLARCEARDSESVLPAVERLEEQVRSLKKIVRVPRSDATDIKPAEDMARNVRQMIKARRKRDEFFGRDLFADPAWDILLEVFAANEAQQKISISAACIAAAVPSTTALRWLAKLEQAGLIVRSADHLDGRRSWVHLSPSATTTMKRYLATFATEGMPI